MGSGPMDDCERFKASNIQDLLEGYFDGLKREAEADDDELTFGD